MTDLYLRGASAVVVDAALIAAGLVGQGGEPVSARIAIDRVGTIERIVDAWPETEALPGYHVNLRAMDGLSAAQVASLAAVTIPVPTQPFRRWA